MDIERLKRLLIGFSIGLVIGACLAASLASANDLTDPYRPDDVSDNLVGYWKFDNDYTDSSTNSNTLTPSGSPVFSTTEYWDLSEQSLDIESGDTQHALVSDPAGGELDFTGDFTIVAWVKVESATAGGQIVSKWSSNTGYEFRTNGTIRFFIGAASEVASTASLNPGQWYHVAVINDDTNSLVTFYINGNVDSVHAFTTSSTDTAHTFYLGTRGGGGDGFDGLLKDVGIFSDVLTSLEIKSLAHGVDLATYEFRPDDSSLTAPTAYWKMNELNDGSGGVNRADSAGSHTLTDASITTSAAGYPEAVSANFDGSNDYFTAANNADFDFGTGDFTVGGWVKFTSTTGAQTFYSYNVDDDISIKKEAAGTFACYLGGVDETGYAWNPVADVWYHVACKRSGTTVTGYINGQSIGTGTSSVDVTDTGSLYVGARSNVAQWVNGQMADWAVWKGTALSDANIASLAATMSIQQSGIVSYWNLDEASGTRADALTGNTLADNATVTQGTGQVGNAADFELDNSEFLSITDGTQTGLDLDADFTLLYWMNQESQPGFGHILDKGNTGTGYGILDVGNDTRFIIQNSIKSTSGTTFSTATWYNVGFVYDQANVFVYVDGSETATAANTTDPSGTGSDFTLGADSAGTFGLYDGLLDEVLVANRAFRPDEVTAVYLKGYNAKELTSSENVAASGRNRLIIIS